MHIQEVRGQNKWPRLTFVVASSIILIVLLLVSGNEAIVKQQRSDDSSQQASVSGGQQSQQQYQQQSAYNNHQQPASTGSVSQPSYSSSVSISSSSSPVASGSQSSSQQGSQASYGQTNSAAAVAPKASNTYTDSLASAVSNPEQSYQAAANNVNMALASSGLYGSSYNQQLPQQQAQQQQQQVGSQSSHSPLNPVHYFYYPAKESSSAQAKASSGASSGNIDIMSNSASTNYQSMAYPSYNDQLASALSSMANPEAAASGQDPSYLPQPGSSIESQLYPNGGSQQQSQHQGSQNSPNAYNGGDISAYSSNLSPQAQVPQVANQGQQSSGSISFNGPTSNGPSGSDFMHSHMAQGHQQQQQSQSQNQMPSMNGYQSNNNLYSSQNDLQTSNFGNNPGGLSSVASYMSPNQPNQQGQSGSSQLDLFSGLGLNGGQFNSAASQLSPTAVPPSSNQQAASSNSLFGSSLFGQQASSGQGANNNPFANQHHYFNPLLSPQQQYNQQIAASQQVGLNGDQFVTAASHPGSSAISPASGSSKRFGISSFIMPMLALAGLSLLIPTMSNIGGLTGRKKRSIEDRASASNRQQQISFDSMNGSSQAAKEMSIGEYMDKIERYYSIYKNAVENDDCLNRLICEFGDAVKDVTGKSAVVMVIEKLVPTWMTGKMHLFKEAALDNKEGKEKCKKYVCHSNKHH